MKKLLLFLGLFCAGMIQAQYITKAGSAATSGAILCFYNDPVDNVLYGIGTITNAGGSTVAGIVAWNGTDWTAKGDFSLTGGTRFTGTENKIARNGDTLYAMATQITHSAGYPMSMLMYWDNSVSNWKAKSYGVFGTNYHLVSYSDTLFAVGNLSGGLDLSEDISAYQSLGQMAYWNGSRWVKYTTAPSFSQNPAGAVVVNGTLYVDDFKYQNGTWTQIGITSVRSMGKWGNKVVFGTEEGTGNYYIKSYDGSSLTTLGTADGEIKGIAEYNDTLAVCGLGLGDISGTSVNKVASFDGTTWRSIYPSYIQGTGAYRLGNYHNQLLISAENGGWYDTQSTPFSIGSVVLVGGALTVDTKEIEAAFSGAYPNPTNGIINFTETQDFVSVYSVEGALLLNATQTNQVDLSNLANGTYYIQVQTQGVTKSISVVKQ